LVTPAAARSAWSRKIGDVRTRVNPETAGCDTMAEEATEAPEKKERKAKKAPEAKEAATAAPAPAEKPVEAKKGAGSRGMYYYMGEAWKDLGSEEMRQLRWQRLIDWRKEGTFVRVDKPLRLDKARALGYKAKPGFVIVRAKVRKGGLRKHRIRKGRRPKRKGILKMTMKKSIQRIAEERTANHYPNLEVLGSYWIGEDGRHKYFEVMMVDPNHPVIKADPKLNWICSPKQSNRANRGLTPAGKKGRGLVRTRGMGVEKNRPSLRAHKRQGT
jgi:large subunit ribosomal protein L15e